MIQENLSSAPFMYNKKIYPLGKKTLTKAQKPNTFYPRGKETRT
jgi:hypothetical protein